MQYRNDKYGNPVSILGFGCMRFPQTLGKIDMAATEELLLHAVESGVNYFDTAYIYPGSEAALGDILHKHGLREKVSIATKLPHYLIRSVEGAEKTFQEELRRLKTDPALLPELPPKTEQPAYCLLTPEQTRLYAREVEKLQAIVHEPDPQTRLTLLLPILSHLKQICNHPAQYLGESYYDPARSGKMSRLSHLARQIAAAGDAALIFTQYRSMMEPLHDFLAGIFGAPGLVLHGGTGLTDEQFIKLIQLGMRKINIATDIFRAAAMADHTEDIFHNITSSAAAVKAVTQKYIALFGSAGKAE